MSLITIIKSDMRLLAATSCLMLVTSAIGQDTSKAQGSSQLGCDEIAVLGAVKAPGRFENPAGMRLLEALTKVGGPSERAGKIVLVVHSCQCSPCAEGEVKSTISSEYNLSAVLAGREEANPLVRAGDRIIVGEAEIVVVYGNVLSRKNLVYREGLTLTQAIAIAGGVARGGYGVRVQIHRNRANGPRIAPHILTLKAVLDNRGEDPLLQPWDIIEVSDEAGKFNLPFSPPFYDPPLPPMRDSPLFQGRSPNC